MFLSGSHVVSAGEEADIKMENIPMATENDPSRVETFSQIAAMTKAGHEITPGSEEYGTNYTGASLKPYYSASTQIECSIMPSSHCTPVFGEEPVLGNPEAELMQTQADPLAIESPGSGIVTVKTESDFSPEDRTGWSGTWWKPNHSVSNQTTNGSYMSASGNCPVVRESAPIKLEDNLVLIQTDPSVNSYNLTTAVVGSSFAAEHGTNVPDSLVGEMKREEVEAGTCSILFKEEHIDEGGEAPTTLVNVHPAVSFEKPFASWDSNGTSAEIFCENVNYGNQLRQQTCVFSGTADSNCVKNSSGPTDSLNWQQSTSFCNTDRIKVRDVSAMLDDLFQDNSRHISKGSTRKRTYPISCTCVMCSVKYVPPVEIRKNNTRKSTVCPIKHSEGYTGNRINAVSCAPVIRLGKCVPRVEIRNVEKNKTRKSNVCVEKLPKKFVKEEWTPCTECSAGFKFRHALKKHLADEHSVHVCIECGEKFECKSDLRTHAITHPVTPYICVFCSFNSKTEAELKVHARSHSASKAFSCTLCRVEFDTNSELSDHMLIHPKERPFGDHSKWKPFQCVHCTVKFTDKRSLKRHVAGLHLNAKRFGCLSCTANFTRKDSLKQHEARHLNEKPFSCVHCPMRFGSESHLKLHLPVHNEKRLSGKLVFKSERQQNSYVCSFE